MHHCAGRAWCSSGSCSSIRPFACVSVCSSICFLLCLTCTIWRSVFIQVSCRYCSTLQPVLANERGCVCSRNKPTFADSVRLEVCWVVLKKIAVHVGSVRSFLRRFGSICSKLDFYRIAPPCPLSTPLQCPPSMGMCGECCWFAFSIGADLSASLAMPSLLVGFAPSHQRTRAHRKQKHWQCSTNGKNKVDCCKLVTFAWECWSPRVLFCSHRRHSSCSEL